jgi:hypothetical protein
VRGAARGKRCRCIFFNFFLFYRYAALPVANGADAATAFERLSSHEVAEDEKEALRRDLLEYCKLDTLAMVELHSALHALVVDGRG